MICTELPKLKTTLKTLKGKTENETQTKKNSTIKFSSYRPALSVCSSPDIRFHQKSTPNIFTLYLPSQYRQEADLQIKDCPSVSRSGAQIQQSSTSTIHLVPACPSNTI